MVKDGKICVSEIFESIDGEGWHSGYPSVFYRVIGCNLRCNYCFGQKKGKYNTVMPCLRLGYQHSNNRTSNSNRIRLDKVKVGDWVMTYDDSLNLVETQVKFVEPRSVEQWYEVTIGGKRYVVTGEHPIFTTKGLKPVSELEIGDIVLDAKYNQYLSYKMSMNNPMKDPEIVQKSLQSRDYELMSKHLSKTIKEKYKKIREYLDSEVPLDLWEPKLKEFYIHHKEAHNNPEFRKKLSESKMGEKNPNWTGVNQNYNSLKKLVHDKVIVRSQLSGKTPEEDEAKGLIVHHIDGNHLNDNPDNLIVVTSREHNQIHERGYNFWPEGRKNKHSLTKVYQANGKEVTSKKFVDITKDKYYGKYYGPKPLTVYTISCEPYNTYLIDDMWVHNCDSQHTFQPDDTCRWLTVEESVKEVEKFNIKHITITGGEPLTEENKYWMTQFIRALLLKGFEIDIETNGAIDYLYWKNTFGPNDVILITDWKTPSSGMNKFMKESNLSILDESDIIKLVVRDDDFDEVEKVLKSGTEAQVYISPVFGQVTMERIPEFVMKHKEYKNLRCQIQIHKIFWDPNKRGV